jgi:hypothetical protein
MYQVNLLVMFTAINVLLSLFTTWVVCLAAVRVPHSDLCTGSNLKEFILIF